MAGTGEPPSESTRIATDEFMGCLTQSELVALSNADQEEGADSGNSSGTRYSSAPEACMAGELGDSFAAGYGGVLSGDLVESFACAAAVCDIDFAVDGLVAKLADTERKYAIADLEAIGLKLSKSYDVRDRDSASSAHYGFYGIDPYSRLEYEVRFYFSREDAREIGVEYVDESTGAGASLYSDDQRWQEGLSERRRCDSSGGHHVGRCGYTKYFDYVVVGNMVLMCEGKETLGSLQACADLLDAVQ
jgi:hypothetical protein